MMFLLLEDLGTYFKIHLQSEATGRQLLENFSLLSTRHPPLGCMIGTVTKKKMPYLPPASISHIVISRHLRMLESESWLQEGICSHSRVRLRHVTCGKRTSRWFLECQRISVSSRIYISAMRSLRAVMQER